MKATDFASTPMQAKRGRKALAMAAATALSAALATTAQAQVSLLPGTYNQAFNTLPTSGTNTWTDNSTLTGWYSSRTTIVSNAGASFSGQLYSYGTGTDAERALGYLASGTLGTGLFGARFLNDVGVGTAIDSFSIAYTGEQWRDGGNASLVAQTTFFEYSTNASSISSGTWTAFSPLDIISPTHTDPGPGVALDGNLAANQQAFSLTSVASGLNIAPDASFWIRWRDPNDTGFDHGLAVDNFQLQYSTATYVPPSRVLTWDSDTDPLGAQNGAGTWSSGGDNWWDGSANATWVSSPPPPDTAVFGTGSGAGSHTVTVHASGVTADQIQFAASSPNYTLSGGAITLDDGGMLANNSATISSAMSLNGDQIWTVGSGSNLTVSGAVSGSKILKSGSGTLVLSNTGNSHNGVQLDAGTIEVSDDGQLGNSTAELVGNGGTIKFTAAETFPGPGGGFGGRTFRLIGGTTTFDTNGNDIEIAGDLAGGGSLIKAGLGTLTLSSPSEADPSLRYTGQTTINAGTLRVNAESNNFSAVGGGNTNINSGGTFHIDNIKMGISNGAVSSRVFLNDGGTLLGTGTLAEYNRADDALTIQNGTSGSPITVDLKTSAATDLFRLGNTVRTGSAPTGLDSSYNKIRVSGPGRIILHSGNPTSTIVFRGEWELNAGTLQVGPINPGSSGEPINGLGFRTNNGTDFDFVPVTINAGAMLAIGVDEQNPTLAIPNNLPAYLRNPVTLNGGKIASTSYDVDPTFGTEDTTKPVHAALGGDLTVQGGTVLLYNPIENAALSGDDYLGPRNVNVVSNGDTTWAGNLTVDPGTASGAALNFNRTGGTVTVSSASTITILEDATVNLDGQNVLSDAGDANHVDIDNQSTTSLHVRTGNHKVGHISGPGKTTVDAGASLTAKSIRQGTLEANGDVKIRVNGGDSGVSRVSSLTVGDTFDLTDNDLIVDGGNYTAIEADVIEGYNNGTWTGTGITSSTAAGNASLLALGVADNDDLNNIEFSGQTGLDGDEILVKHTYVGDANLTGGVNLDDFNQFLFGFNPINAAPQIWLNGDFNYTGSVNLDDFNLFLFGLANQGGTLVSPELFAALSQFVGANDVDVDLSAVPEPASFSVLALGAMSLLARRRR